MGGATNTKKAPRPDMLNVARLQRDAKAELVCGDNLRYMRALADESMHLIVTSPPYNIGKEYETRKLQDIYSRP